IVFSGVAGSRLDIGDVAAPAEWSDGTASFPVGASLLAVAQTLPSPPVPLERCTPVPPDPPGPRVCLDHPPRIVAGGSGECAAPVTTAFLAASNLSDTGRADRARGRRVTSRRPRVAAACDWERAASPACAGERAPRAIKNRVGRACRLLAKAAAATPGSAAARMAERRERKS